MHLVSRCTLPPYSLHRVALPQRRPRTTETSDYGLKCATVVTLNISSFLIVYLRYLVIMVEARSYLSPYNLIFLMEYIYNPAWEIYENLCWLPGVLDLVTADCCLSPGLGFPKHTIQTHTTEHETWLWSSIFFWFFFGMVLPVCLPISSAHGVAHLPC